jgi:hypothetical protein
MEGRLPTNSSIDASLVVGKPEAIYQLLKNRHYTHWGKIERSNLRKAAELRSHLLYHSWIGHFISSKCVSISAQNAPNMSIYSSIRRECFRTDLRGSGVATGQTTFLSPSGREPTEKKHRCGDRCIRHEY